jgi:hypothetical protein
MPPNVIADTNLSLVWGKAFMALMEPGCSEISPLVVRIHGFKGMPDEHPDIRHRLDEVLQRHGEQPCHTVAGTIFPQSMWNPALSNDAEVLFQRYGRAWRGIKKCPQNRIGVYFQRLTAYQPKDAIKPINQLRSIVEIYRSGCHRRSALQASILDPSRDLSASRLRGFPCLQQVSFIPHDTELEMVAFYPMQYHFEKSYGNYLGLCHLGRFMAKQMGLTFTSLACVAAVLKRGDPPKHELAPLAAHVNGVLQNI